MVAWKRRTVGFTVLWYYLLACWRYICLRGAPRIALLPSLCPFLALCSSAPLRFAHRALCMLPSLPFRSICLPLMARRNSAWARARSGGMLRIGRSKNYRAGMYLIAFFFSWHCGDMAANDSTC